MSIVAALVAASSFAQTNSGGFTLSETTVYYGARVGLNLATLTGDRTDDAKLKGGLNLGAVVGLRISDATPLFLESGLYFTQCGANGKDDYEVNLNYLEIPVLIKYGFQATDEISVLPYIGPTFRYGVGGKIKDGKESESSFGDKKYSRPDVGIKIGCGAEWNKLYLELGYQFGVTNILDDDNKSQHNGALFVNFGVNF